MPNNLAWHVKEFVERRIGLALYEAYSKSVPNGYTDYTLKNNTETAYAGMKFELESGGGLVGQSDFIFKFGQLNIEIIELRTQIKALTQQIEAMTFVADNNNYKLVLKENDEGVTDTNNVEVAPSSESDTGTATVF